MKTEYPNTVKIQFVKLREGLEDEFLVEDQLEGQILEETWFKVQDQVWDQVASQIQFEVRDKSS